MICKRFPSLRALQKWVQAIAKAQPDLLSARVLHLVEGRSHVIIVTPGVHEKLLNASVTQGKLVELTREQMSLSHEVRLFLLLPPCTKQIATPGIYVLLPEQGVKELVSVCLNLGIFDLGAVTFSSQTLVHIRTQECTYLAGLLMESIPCEVYLRDATDVMHPWPTLLEHENRLGNEPGTLTILSKNGILCLEQVEFSNLMESVDWKSSLQVHKLPCARPDFHFDIQLRAIKSQSQSQEQLLWIYDAANMQKLLQWVEDLPLASRSQFSVVVLENNSLVLKARDKGLETPPGYLKAYRPYPGTVQILIEADYYLRPPLPSSELLRVLSPGSTQILLLSAQGSGFEIFVFNTLELKPLEDLVRYAYVLNRDTFDAVLREFRIRDPQVDLYDLEEIEILKQETRAGSGGSLSRQIPLQEDIAQPSVEPASMEDSEPEAEEFELPTDRNQLLQVLLDLQSRVRQNPRESLVDRLKTIARTCRALDDLPLAIHCMELAVYFQLPAEASELTAELFSWWQEMVGKPAQVTLAQLFSKDDGLREEDFLYLSFYVMAVGSKISSSERKFLQERMGQALELCSDSQSLFRNLNFLYFQQTCLGTDRFRLLRLRDRLLGRVFEQGLADRKELPEFLLQDEDLQAKLREGMRQGLLSVLASQNIETADKMFAQIGLALFFANVQDQGSYMQAVEAARRLCPTQNPVCSVVLNIYLERARLMLLRESITKEYLDQQLKQLRAQDAYKVHRLLQVSLIFDTTDQLVPEPDSWGHEFRRLRRMSSEELISQIPLLISKSLEADGQDMESASFRRATLFSTILEVLPRTGEEFSLRIIHRLHSVMEELSALEHKATVLGRMIAVVSLYRQADLREKLMHEFLQILQKIQPGQISILDRILVPMRSRFSSLIPREMHAEVLGRMESLIKGKDLLNIRLRTLIAILWDHCGDEAKALSHITTALDDYLAIQNAPNSEKLACFLYILRGCRDTGVGTRLLLKDLISQRLYQFMDTMSTSSHLSLSRTLALEFLALPHGVSERDGDQGGISHELHHLHLELESLFKVSMNRQHDYLMQLEEN